MAAQPSLGMPTLIEFDALEDNIQLCRKLGLSFIELNCNSPLFIPEALPAERLRRLAQREGIGFSVHLPEELDLAGFEPEMRKGNVACVRSAIRWAAEAGIERLTMHLRAGVYFSLPEGKVWLYEKHREQFVGNLMDSMAELHKPLTDSQVHLLLENTGQWRLAFLQEALESVLTTSSPQVGITWDIGHDVQVNRSDEPGIRRHLQHVRHLHLHDTDGKSAHLPLCTGLIDVPAMLKFAKSRDIPVVIEVKTAQALEQSVAALRRYFEQ